MRITRARVLELLTYDAKAGQLRWKQRRGRGLAGAVAGSLDDKGYGVIGIDGIRHYIHRIIYLIETGTLPPRVDHRNLDITNNRFSNLRPCSSTQNQQNTPKRRGRYSSRYKGVYYCKSPRLKNRWAAQIKDNGRRVWLGSHRSERAAAKAYDVAARARHGEFAQLNFRRG
jgi:hypothetical protein